MLMLMLIFVLMLMLLLMPIPLASPSLPTNWGPRVSACPARALHASNCIPARWAHPEQRK